MPPAFAASGQAIVYPGRDLALSGTVDWAGNSSGSFTVVGAQAEWLVSEKTPLSIFGAYNYVSGAGASVNAFRVGVKYYIGGAGTLVRRQRNGVDDWSGSTRCFGTCSNRSIGR